MGILIDEKTVAIVQGITGNQGNFHTRLMLDYGTKIVAGVTPGKGGTETHGLPVYDTVEEAKKKHSPNASIIFVPPFSATKAAHEALDSGIETVVIITEHIPAKDAIGIISHAAEVKAKIIGPNTPGIITPGKSKLGIMPNHVFKEGRVGLISRSGTLTYEIAAGLTSAMIGQSTCLGIGGDLVAGVSFVEALELFKRDPQTEAVVLIGEIGGNMEEVAAEYIEKSYYGKTIVAYIAGRFAPEGRRMGHAGAIIMGKSGTAKSKIEALQRASVFVAEKPRDLTEYLQRVPRR